MKKIKTIFVLIILLSGISMLQAQSDKIRIKLHQPPPGKLGVADLWSLSITNTTNENLTVHVGGIASEEKDGLIIEAKSKPFTLKPGTTKYKHTDFSNAEIKYNNGKYKEILMRTGNAPEGNYTICLTAFFENGEVAAQEYCIEQKVELNITREIHLIYPCEEKEIDTDQPITFSWTPVNNIKEYTFQLFKGGLDEDEETMVNTKKPVYEEKNIKMAVLRYKPDINEEDAAGKKYVWVILAGELYSRPCWFRPKPANLCKYLKFDLKKISDIKDSSCCYLISVANSYTGLSQNSPFSIGVSISNGSIISGSGTASGFNQTPANIPPSVNNVTWSAKDKIEEGRIDLAKICIDSKISPNYLVYEWKNKNGKVICKDSVKIECKGGNNEPSYHDSVCAGNLIQNGNFILNNTPGIMPSGSVSNWLKGYGSPGVYNDPNDGCWDIGHIKLAGNKISGDCIKQTLNPANKIILGRKYKLTVSIKFLAQNSSTDYVKIRAIAFNNILPPGPNHPGPNTDRAIIGISPKIRECAGWTVFDFPVWIANKNFDNIAINAENNETSLNSTAFIDNVKMCEVSDMDCNEIALDAQGNPIIPPNIAPFIDPNCPIENENINEINGNINDLYGELYGANGTDTWYSNMQDPCGNIGGTLPDEVTGYNCDDSLSALGLNMTCEELTANINQQVTVPDTANFRISPIPPVNFGTDCDSLFALDSTKPFGGRDIIYVHGLKLDHLCDRSQGITGADKNWPDDPAEFYGNGYYKQLAVKTWEDHIYNFLQGRNASNPPTNRYLVVGYNCSQRLEVGVHAIITQIREAMQNGTGVVPNGDRRGTRCFGKNYVIISHSTGGEVTDVMLSIMGMTTYDPLFTAKWGNLSSLLSGCRAHIALHPALSGSNMAKIFVLANTNILSSWLISKISLKQACWNPNWVQPGIVWGSILIDLIPEYAQTHWGPYIGAVPVDVITVAGGQEISGFDGAFQNIMHRGLDDGVLSMDCQCGNPTPQLLGPTTYQPTSPVKVFDMGIEVGRAVRYYIDQKWAANTFAAGCIPFLSPTGMVQPVAWFQPNALARYPRHFSFIHSASDHMKGPRGFSLEQDPYPFDIANPYSTSGYILPCKDYNFSGVGRNWEECRVITDSYVYNSGLIKNSVANMVYEEQRGLKISFTIKYPWFKNWKLVWISKTFEFWVWKRKYHLLEGSNCGKTENDYVYEYVLR